MKNKLFTVSSAQLNAGYYLDVSFSLTPTSVIGSRTDFYLPNELILTNSSGAAIRYITLTQAEYNEFSANPSLTYYERIPVASAAVETITSLESVYRIFLEKVLAATSSPLTILCKKYTKRGQ